MVCRKRKADSAFVEIDSEKTKSIKTTDTSSSSLKLNQLNDDCLLHIFRHLAPRELIPLRSVCRRWHKLVSISGQTVHSLKLFGSIQDVRNYTLALVRYCLESDPYYAVNPSLPHTTHNELIGVDRYSVWQRTKRIKRALRNASSNNMPICVGNGGRFLSTLFPNIHHLIVRYSGQDELDLLTLLTSTTWQRSLQSLTLFEVPDIPRLHSELLSALNSCTSLKRFELFNTFHLEQDPWLKTDVLLKNIPVQTFAQLEAVTFANFDCHQLAHVFNYFTDRLHSLSVHGCSRINTQVLSFWIGKSASNIIAPGAAAAVAKVGNGAGTVSERSWVRKLTTLTLNSVFVDSGLSVDTLEMIAEHFVSLKSFTFMPEMDIVDFSPNFLSIIEPLRSLRHLSSLSIVYYSAFGKARDLNYLNSMVNQELMAADEVGLFLPFDDVLPDNNNNLQWLQPPRVLEPPAPLHNIKQLTLRNSRFLYNYPTMFCRLIPHLFPSLQVLSMAERCSKANFGRMRSTLRIMIQSLVKTSINIPTSLLSSVNGSLHLNISDLQHMPVSSIKRGKLRVSSKPHLSSSASSSLSTKSPINTSKYLKYRLSYLNQISLNWISLRNTPQEELLGSALLANLRKFEHNFNEYCAWKNANDSEVTTFANDSSVRTKQSLR